MFIPAQGFERFSSKSGILLEVLFDPPRKLTHEQATRLSLKDHARIWKVGSSLYDQIYDSNLAADFRALECAIVCIEDKSRTK